jgi:hypothetical protein
MVPPLLLLLPLPLLCWRAGWERGSAVAAAARQCRQGKWPQCDSRRCCWAAARRVGVVRAPQHFVGRGAYRSPRENV